MNVKVKLLKYKFRHLLCSMNVFIDQLFSKAGLSTRVLIWYDFLKLINYSRSLNKGNHDREGVWISDLISIGS